MTVLTMVVDALAFLLLVLLVLSVVGFGVVELMLPEMRGLQWLLSPVVGLVALYLACQWLSPLLSSAVIVVGVLVAGAALTLVAIWRRNGPPWRALVLGRFDLLATGLTGVATYFTLLAHQFKLGFFTLAGTGLDALFIYAPVGEFMRDHDYAAGDTPPVKTPAISTLEADFYPGSLGTVDGGLSALLRRPVYQIIEPLNAVCFVLAILGVYVLVVGALRLSRATGLLAIALTATSQYLLWAAGFDFVQQIRALALLPGALALVLFALEQGRVRAAVVAGGMAAAMVAIYLPVFLILVAATAGGLVVATVVGLRRREWTLSPTALGALLLSGPLLGLTHVHWLVVEDGLTVWNLVSQDKFGPYAAGGALATHYSPAELLGTSSLANVYRFKPLLFWNGAWTALGSVAVVVAVALAVFGLVTMVRARRWLWVGAVGALVLYLLYVRFGPTNLYGFVKTVSYALPITAAAVAAGIASLAGIRLGRRAGRPGARAPALIAGAAAVLVLGMQVTSAVETGHLFLELEPTISLAQAGLKPLGEMVPAKASVFVADPGPLYPGTPLTPYTNVNHIAAYFLDDANVTLGPPGNPVPTGDFHYLVAPAAAPAVPGYAPVWANAGTGLVLYRSAQT